MIFAFSEVWEPHPPISLDIGVGDRARPASPHTRCALSASLWLLALSVSTKIVSARLFCRGVPRRADAHLALLPLTRSALFPPRKFYIRASITIARPLPLCPLVAPLALSHQTSCAIRRRSTSPRERSLVYRDRFHHITPLACFGPALSITWYTFCDLSSSISRNIRERKLFLWLPRVNVSHAHASLLPSCLVLADRLSDHILFIPTLVHAMCVLPVQPSSVASYRRRMVLIPSRSLRVSWWVI